jgi:hypothetical protein
MNDEKFYGYIYVTINQQTKKVYVGQSIDFKKIDNYLGSGTRFLKSVKHYGKKFFKKRILGIIEADSEEELSILLNEAETECIYFYRSYGSDGINCDEIYGYNLLLNGRNNLDTKNIKHSLDHTKNQADAQRGKKCPQRGRKNKKQSLEHVEKIKEIKKINRELRIIEGTEYHPTLETKNKVSESGRKTRALQKLNGTLYHPTPETIAKRVVTQKKNRELKKLNGTAYYPSLEHIEKIKATRKRNQELKKLQEKK